MKAKIFYTKASQNDKKPQRIYQTIVLAGVAQ